MKEGMPSLLAGWGGAVGVLPAMTHCAENPQTGGTGEGMTTQECVG